MANPGEAILGKTNRKSSQSLYIACEEMNFHWSAAEVMRFRHFWNTGESVTDIAEHFKRDPDEVGLLIIDQAKKDLIKPRKGGVL